MGCTSGKQKLYKIDEEYAKNKNLPLPDTSLYENEFEKEAFMTVNLFRANPKEFVSIIREISNSNLYKGKRSGELIKLIEGGLSLTVVNMDATAMKACRQTLDDWKKNSSNDPPQKGVCAQNLAKMASQDQKMAEGQDFAYVNWKGSARDLIILNLLQEFEKSDSANKPALINARLLRFGVSMKGNEKGTNVGQILYVLQKSNTMV